MKQPEENEDRRTDDGGEYATPALAVEAGIGLKKKKCRRSA
jgi:hypothetical protein